MNTSLLLGIENKLIDMSSTNNRLERQSKKPTLGFLGKIFTNVIAFFLLKSPLGRAVNRTDRKMAKSRKKILESADGDEEKVKQALSPKVRKALGFDF